MSLNQILKEVRDYIDKIRGSNPQTDNFLDDITNTYSSILQHIGSLSTEYGTTSPKGESFISHICIYYYLFMFINYYFYNIWRNVNKIF